MFEKIRKTEIYLYVGPHKSGTNFLKYEIFPNIDDVYDVLSEDQEILNSILRAFQEHPLFLNIKKLKAEIEDRLGGVTQTKIVLSSPEFFGSFENMIDSNSYNATPFSDSRYRAEILCKLFPTAKVIITPRRQDQWIESYYRGVLKSYHSVSIENFVIDHEMAGVSHRAPVCDYSTLDWNVYIENYKSIFGSDNVFVAPNEMMRFDLREFLDRLFEFMCVSGYFPQNTKIVNRSYSLVSCKIAVLLNRFIIAPHNKFGFLPNRPFISFLVARKQSSRLFRVLAGISRRLSLYWFLNEIVDRYFKDTTEILDEKNRKKILDFYEVKNRRYAQAIGIDLEKYGYY